MIIRDVMNTRPPEMLAAWLAGLGEFEEIRPHEAAERWAVPIREAMERLHAMTGGPLEIPVGAVEVYRPSNWTAEASTTTRVHQTKAVDVLLRRLSQIPEEGATRAQLQELWGIGEAGVDKAITRLERMKSITFEWRGRYKIWRRSSHG